MTGVWSTRSNLFYYTGLNGYQLDKLLQKCKRKGEGKKKQWFVPAQYLTEQAKQDLILTEENEDQFLDELASNVDFNQQDDPELKQLNKQYKKAKIAKTKKDTEVQEERLERRKLELYNQWSERFYQVFADSFGRMKNCLVAMHLNQEQIAVFNQTLQNCLNNMQLNLTDIWNQFTHKEGEDAQAEET